eukprot:TRINITY_DN1424_c1_g3_i4.p1 TRINITY_DN1424_c1_g3~~TRINITY_DN1424_c1_g3_i4.p1  ORF type:complete len:667 (-),score=177.37 TRINITY_DN1424_c1_g3_i4:2177-4057(-)
MDALGAYSSESDEEEVGCTHSPSKGKTSPSEATSSQKTSSENAIPDSREEREKDFTHVKSEIVSHSFRINPNPQVVAAPVNLTGILRRGDDTSIPFNAPTSVMHAPVAGPVAEGYRTKAEAAAHNVVTGSAERFYVDDYLFRESMSSFSRGEKGVDELGIEKGKEKKEKKEKKREVKKEGNGVMKDEAESMETEGEKSKRRRRATPWGKPGSGEYRGPWAPFEGEMVGLSGKDQSSSGLEPGDAEADVESKEGEPDVKRRKASEVLEEEDQVPGMVVSGETGGEGETTKYHGRLDQFHDYMGRTFVDHPSHMHDHVEDTFKCFTPKKWLHTWKGHTAGVQAIRFFPKYGHLLLSCSMDGKVKIWDVFQHRRCVRTYTSHQKAVRDVCFMNDGRRFVSVGFDRRVIVWDTEYGKIIRDMSNGRLPYCVKVHPDDDKQNICLVGCSDKKIHQWDIERGEVVQEYNEHLATVNTITFIDQNRKFVSSSDDKTLRVWEYGMPVQLKLIQESWMHSMPAISLSPNKKWMAAQCMDNQVAIYHADKVKEHKKKRFKGHSSAGYACQVGFSPDGRFVISGDAHGFLFVWDWKTCKVIRKLKAHDQVCIGCEWHPQETSKVATCSWDGTIKYWD